MPAHNLITVSAAGTINYYTPPQTTPHKSVTVDAPEALSRTLPLLLHQKSSITHPATRNRHSTPPITALTASPPLLVTGDKEGFVTLHQPGFAPARFALHIGEISQIGICDSAETLFTASVDGCVHISPIHNPVPAVTLRHPLPVTAFTQGYSGVSGRIVTACVDRSTRVWHAASGKLLATVKHATRVTAIAANVTEDYVWGDADGAIGLVRVGELPVGGLVQARVLAKRDASLGVGVGVVVLSPEGAVVGYDDGVIQVYDLMSGVLLRAFGAGGAVVGLYVDIGGSDSVDGLFDDGVVVGGAGRGVSDVLEMVGDVFGSKEGESNQALEREVLWLRQRNKELEDAGTRLIELVEQG